MCTVSVSLPPDVTQSGASEAVTGTFVDAPLDPPALEAGDAGGAKAMTPGDGGCAADPAPGDSVAVPVRFDEDEDDEPLVAEFVPAA